MYILLLLLLYFPTPSLSLKIKMYKKYVKELMGRWDGKWKMNKKKYEENGKKRKTGKKLL